VEFQIQLSKDDWFIYQKHTGKRVCSKLKGTSFGFLKNMILWMITSIIFFTLFQTVGDLHWPTAIAIFIICSAIGFFSYMHTIRVRSAMEPLENGVTYAPQKYKIDENGIYSNSKSIESACKWDAVVSVDRANGQILLYIDTLQAFIFPESQLDNADELYSFIENHRKL